MAHIGKVLEQLKTGGYYDRIMQGGPELGRMKAFLLACAADPADSRLHPLQRPHYPSFAGLTPRPWYDPRDFAAVRILENGFADIRAEALALRGTARLDYSRAAHPWRSWKKPWTLLRPDAPAATWTVYPLFHMGANLEVVNGYCPKTMAIVSQLPGACTGYTWGDCIFSTMAAHSHLRPHCSIDNLRVRIHLGVEIPPGCSIRVGTEVRSWEEGRCLVFDDAFEHEVWNRSPSRRTVLIVDLWHPELTGIEIRALTAAFRKSSVRRIFMYERLGITDAPEKYLQHIEAGLAHDDEDPLVREFWPH